MQESRPGLDLSITLVFCLSLGSLVAAGCSSADKNPCAKACKKYTSCNAPKDKGTPKGEAGGGSKDAGPGVGSRSLFMAGGPGSGACSYSEACSPKEQCLSGCINAASCSALTGKDKAAVKVVNDCLLKCNQKKWDGGVKKDKGGGKKDKGNCQKKCQGKVCGPDGCGGQCGPKCPTGKNCNGQGQCVPGCQPKCAGRECGPDGCGGQCGPKCPTNLLSNSSGKCVPNCQPDCGGKQCGDNGCGGSCGTCPTGQTCNKTKFLCEAGCQPDCAGKQCGDNGCGGSCGTCPTGQTCNNTKFVCEPGCTPQCTGKQCGPDGCGSTCGTCKSYETCDSAGKCNQTGCGPITSKGCCDGTTLKYCQGTTYKTIDCTKNPSCGWSSQGSFYDCGTSGYSDPSGQYAKACP